MPVAAPVATFLLGAGASTTVAAVGAAVVQGAVYGAVIGAATSLATGGNILEGALKGALVGGVSAGLYSGLSMATGVSTASEQLAGMGVSSETLAKAGVDVGTATGEATAGAGAGGAGTEVPSGTTPPPTTPPTVPTEYGMMTPEQLKALEKTKIISGVGQGAAQGLLQVGAASIKSKSEEDIAEQEQRALRERIAQNKVGNLEQRIINIRLPEKWMAFTNPLMKYQKAGLLSQGA